MRKGRIRYLPVSLLFIFLLSCGRNVAFTDTSTMRGKTWKIADVPLFRIPIKDTINNNNIYFIIRTGTSYPFRNIYLFVTTTSPDGKSVTDTLNYDLADEKGNWFGRGFGDIHELKLPFRSNVYFPFSGTYKIRVQHGMRTENLKGVYDFGIRVEKISKK